MKYCELHRYGQIYCEFITSYKLNKSLYKYFYSKTVIADIIALVNCLFFKTGRHRCPLKFVNWEPFLIRWIHDDSDEVHEHAWYDEYFYCKKFFRQFWFVTSKMSLLLWNTYNNTQYLSQIQFTLTIQSCLLCHILNIQVVYNYYFVFIFFCRNEKLKTSVSSDVNLLFSITQRG